jgi:hypothetical protein
MSCADQGLGQAKGQKKALAFHAFFCCRLASAILAEFSSLSLLSTRLHKPLLVNDFIKADIASYSA